MNFVTFAFNKLLSDKSEKPIEAEVEATVDEESVDKVKSVTKKKK